MPQNNLIQLLNNMLCSNCGHDMAAEKEEEEDEDSDMTIQDEDETSLECNTEPARNANDLDMIIDRYYRTCVRDEDSLVYKHRILEVLPLYDSQSRNDGHFEEMLISLKEMCEQPPNNAFNDCVMDFLENYVTDVLGDNDYHRMKEFYTTIVSVFEIPVSSHFVPPIPEC